MLHKNLLLLSFALIPLFGCKTTDVKSDAAKDTPAPQEAPAVPPQTPAATPPPLALSDSASLKETLQNIQNSVFAIEDKLYGTKKLGTLGLYGEFKNCKRKMASRQYGGSGDLLWTEPMDRVTDKEANVKATTDSELQTQIMRFRGYQTILQRRTDEFEANITSCKEDLAKHELDSNQSSRVMVTEVSKGSMDKASVNEFLCQFVKKDASLRGLLVELFAKSWLSLADFAMDQNLIGSSLKDSKGVSRDNGLLFNGWKLSFDQSKVTVGELLSGDKDAKLVAWSYSTVNDVKDHEKCLKTDPQWNP